MEKRWPVSQSKNRDNTTTSPPQAHGMNPRSTAVLSPISRLPPKLLVRIMRYLPTSSQIVLRRCNKQLYLNGGPESPNLLYSRLCNHKNKDDHLWLLCLLERDAPQRAVCWVCMAMHKTSFFDAAELSKPSESRKCRMVRICPHRNMTFAGLQRIISGYSTLSVNRPKTWRTCKYYDCLIKGMWPDCPREARFTLDVEKCCTTLSYKRFWEKGLYLSTALVIYSAESICPKRSKKSLAWTWHLCPHLTMKDCCDCCQVDDPRRIKLDRCLGEPQSTVRNGRVMQCKLCCTKIRISDFGELQDRRVGRVVTIDRYLGRGESVEDADWLRQTMPEPRCPTSRQSKRRGLGVVAADCYANFSDLWPWPHRSTGKWLYELLADN